MKFQRTILLFILIHKVFTRDAVSVQFIKSFILNEQKPTSIIFCELCWNKSIQVSLAIEVSKVGARSSKLWSTKSKYQDQHLLFLADLECPKFDELISLASARQLFSLPYRWLVLTNSTEHQRLVSLRNSSVHADSDLVLAERTGNHFNLIELHKPSPYGVMVMTPRGFYNGTLIDERERRELFQRRRDLMGHPLTMANVIQDSNSTQYHLPREDGLEPHHDIISKICWMNVKLAFEMLNATPKYIFSYRWGYKVNGQWSGMINDLKTGRADVGTNCVVSDKERLHVVAYTDTLAPFRVQFIFRQPPLPAVSNIFALPFSTSVWVAIVVCTLVGTVTIYLASRWEVRFGRSPTLLDGTICDAMLLTMSALSQQGCVMEPKKASGRITLVVLFLALMALYAAYSANIVVLLQAPSNSIKTLAQLSASKITLAANDVDYNRFVFSLYKDPVRVNIYKRIQPEKGKGQFYDLHEGVEKMRQGLFAFHSIVEPVYRRVEETFLESEKCDLTEINFLTTFDPYVPVKKDSPYLELLRVVFKRIRETGIQNALNERHQAGRGGCARGRPAAPFSSVALRDARPALQLALCGALLALATLAAELFVHAVGPASPRIHINVPCNMEFHKRKLSA